MPRNQNPQRRPRRKRYGKLQGQRSQSLKLTTLTMNRKTEKKEQAQKKLPSPGAKASGQTKKIKKTVTEDEDDDRLDDLIIMESKVPDIEEYDDDRDKDYDWVRRTMMIFRYRLSEHVNQHEAVTS